MLFHKKEIHAKNACSAEYAPQLGSTRALRVDASQKRVKTETCKIQWKKANTIQNDLRIAQHRSVHSRHDNAFEALMINVKQQKLQIDLKKDAEG